jgi:hypothetical protein
MLRILIFIYLFLFSSYAIAWSATGHKIVAQIAYDNLIPMTKTQIGLEEKEFIQAATWADQIRGERNTQQFDAWHHLQLVPAINKNRAVLKNPNIASTDKLLALRFLTHLVGDIHQPLHCTQDDKGGNRFLINSPHAKNLHALWDGGVGLFKKRSIKKLAHHLEADYPLQSYRSLVHENDPNVWFKECRALAKNVAYTIRRGSTPSQEYIQQGQDVVKSQLALAGYRLAYQLNVIFQRP